MAIDLKPLSELLETLTDAITSATAAFPSDEEAFLPPADGISLLDIKNDLLLSYLQHLVFLILLRLRNHGKVDEADSVPTDEVIRKLVELRVYLERGVRPLEGRLKYQIDKVLRAAEDADRQTTQKDKKQKPKRINGTSGHDSSDISNSDSNSDADSGDEEEQLDEESFRPNTAALARAAATQNRTNSDSRTSRNTNGAGGGTYKPPRITPTSMPAPPSASHEDRAASRRRKSNLIDEYVDDELSTAPRAQPSIGSNNTILDRGRGGLSARDREKERERTDYEERNFTRLPAESKAERKKASARGVRERRDMFGGEDWTGLGGLGDRINRTVAGGRGASVLERREKRRRDTQDAPRGDGVGIGETFEKRRKVMQGRSDRKMSKRR